MLWSWWLVVQLVVCCCAGVLVVLWWLWATKLHIDAPGPATLPIIGNILEFLEVPLTTRKVRDVHRQYGDLTRLYLGPMLVVLVAHPDDVQHILLTSKLVERDPFTSHALQIFLGDGLLSLNGSRWKVHRKLINPTFHSELLEGFLEAFHGGALFMCERLARTQGQPTDVHPLVFFGALRSLCNAAAGIDPDLLIPDTLAEEEVASAMKDVMATIQKLIVRPWLQSKLLLRLTSSGRSLFKYQQMLQDGVMRCIAMRSAATDEGPAKTRRRLLEALVKPGGQTAMPLTDVQDELMTIVMTGTETMSVAMSYMLALLSLHPTWQDAAHQELRNVFGEGDDYLRAASLADLSSLRVLDSIVKESLRLFPVVTLIPRKCTEDIRLAGGRVLVPKGALLAVAPFLTHRLPQFFPDPESFDPSRFLDGCAGKEHPGSYLPFGLGARNCVGGQYARLQVKVFLADILRRFRILPHSSREDLEQNTISVSSHTILPIRVSCVPLQGPCS